MYYIVYETNKGFLLLQMANLDLCWLQLTQTQELLKDMKVLQNKQHYHKYQIS